MSINLQTASTYGILASGSVVSTGNTVVQGDVGTQGNLTGFPPGTVTGSTLIQTDVVNQAITDANNALTQGNQLTPVASFDGNFINSILVTDDGYGVFDINGDLTITGSLTLDGGVVRDNQFVDGLDSVFVLRISGKMVMNPGSSIQLVNGSGSPRVFFLVNNTDFTAPLGALIQDSAHLNGTLIVANGDLAVNNTARTGALINLDSNSDLILDTVDVTSFQNYAPTGGDPHCICLDGSRIDLYEAGFYRLFDNLKTDTDQRIVINAEVRRDPFDHLDYYHQVWLQINEQKCLIEFTSKGLGDQGSFFKINGQLQTDLRWEHSYMVGSLCYKLVCEAHYNTVMLSVPCSVRGHVASGLMVGQIIPVSHLRDTQLQMELGIQVPSQYYDQNALVAGSVGPHVITVQKQAIYPKHNWYRLLQWKTKISRGTINIRLDSTGQVRELIQKISYNRSTTCSETGSLVSEWQWLGEEHWNLSAWYNKTEVNRLYVHEEVLVISEESEILLRIQGNGSISAGFRKVRGLVRGLMFGDVLETSGPYDDFIENLPEVKQDLTHLTQNLSIYQRHIEYLQ